MQCHELCGVPKVIYAQEMQHSHEQSPVSDECLFYLHQFIRQLVRCLTQSEVVCRLDTCFLVLPQVQGKTHVELRLTQSALAVDSIPFDDLLEERATALTIARKGIINLDDVGLRGGVQCGIHLFKQVCNMESKL